MLLTTRIALRQTIHMFTAVCHYSTTSTVENKKNSILPIVKKITNCRGITSSRYSENRWKLLKDASENLDQKVRVVSYNILWNLYEEKQKYEYRWENRFDRVANTMLDGDSDIIGLQEDRTQLLEDLLPFYDPSYERVGEPSYSDECCSLLFKRNRFDFISSSSVSLSTVKPRHLTCLRVFDKTTEIVLNVFNTHLHFTSLKSRQEQARELSAYMTETLETIDDNERVILLGDFNTFPNRPDIHKSTPLDGEEIEAYIEDSTLANTMKTAIFGCVGPKSSYNNCAESQILYNRCVPFEGLGVPGVYLDHIYTCQKVQVLIHAINPVTFNGLFGSDHMPVVCDILVK